MPLSAANRCPGLGDASPSTTPISLLQHDWGARGHWCLLDFTLPRAKGLTLTYRGPLDRVTGNSNPSPAGQDQAIRNLEKEAAHLDYIAKTYEMAMESHQLEWLDIGSKLWREEKDNSSDKRGCPIP